MSHQSSVLPNLLSIIVLNFMCNNHREYVVSLKCRVIRKIVKLFGWRDTVKVLYEALKVCRGFKTWKKVYGMFVKCSHCARNVFEGLRRCTNYTSFKVNLFH